MENLKIKEVIEACNGSLMCGNLEDEVTGFSIDTRKINNNDVYVGIMGENIDGNSYYNKAIQNGASGCIIEKHYENKIDLDIVKNKNIIIVENSIKALQDIAKYKRNKTNIPVIAITGSVGKTSTKDIIASAISKKFNVLKTEGNNNNHIGLPLTILKLTNQNAMVLEMGMNHFGEIEVLSKIARPDVCVITNIGTAHIGNLGSRENILKAKLEILGGMPKNGVVIVNNDNDLLNKWAKENKNKYNIVTYGIENTSDYMADNIKLNDKNTQYNININGKTYTVIVPVSGNPFVYNSLSAIATGINYNMDINDIIKGISETELTKNRMEVLKQNGITYINDSYNASYDSNKAAIEYLKNSIGNRKIAVLGDMLELGEYSKELHEKVGEEVAKNNIDILITVGEKAKSIGEKARKLGVENCVEFMKNEEAAKYLRELLKNDDVVLLKASNSMKFGEILKKII